MASRLADSQRASGHRAWVHSLIGNSLWANPWQRPLHSLAAAIDHYGVKDSANASPVSLLRDALSSRLPRSVKDADIIHVHWPHGVIGLQDLGALSQSTRVVWTLHDMNAFTSVCHYAIGCACHKSSSGNCTGVRPIFRTAAGRHRQRKHEFVEGHPGIQFVSPSKWLAQEAAESHVMRGLQLPVVPNPLPPSLPSLKEVRANGGAVKRSAGPIFVASASELSDPVKNIASIVTAFERAFAPESAAQLLVIGRGAIQTNHPGVSFLGHLTHNQLLKTLSISDWLVVASLAENQPLAISEAQAMGVSLLAAHRTGLPEHLDIDAEGASFQDEAGLVDLFRFLGQKRRSAAAREKLVKAARKKFDPALAAARYEELYRSMPLARG